MLICAGCAVGRVPVGSGPPFLRAAGMLRLSDLRAISPPAWSPSGRRIAFSTAGAVWAVRLAGRGRRERRLATLAGVRRVAWLPDGQALALLAGGRLWTVNLDDPTPRLLVSGAGIRDFAWDPDRPARRGWRMAYVAPADQRPATMKLKPADQRPAEGPREGATMKAGLAVRVAESGARAAIVAGSVPSGAAVRGVTWLSGGAGIAVAIAGPGRPDRIMLVSPYAARAARPRVLTAGGDPVPSPEGRFIAFLDAGRVVVVRRDGTGRRVLTDAGVYTGLAWSPSGTLLALAKQDGDRVALEVVSVLTGERVRIGEYRPELAPSAAPFALAWAPDGMRLAAGTDSGAAEGFVWVATLERR